MVTLISGLAYSSNQEILAWPASCMEMCIRDRAQVVGNGGTLLTNAFAEAFLRQSVLFQQMLEMCIRDRDYITKKNQKLKEFSSFACLI